MNIITRNYRYVFKQFTEEDVKGAKLNMPEVEDNLQEELRKRVHTVSSLKEAAYYK